MIHPVRELLVENGGLDRSHCEGPAFDALCTAERRRLGAADDAGLAEMLRSDEHALHAFVAHVAVPETWFFRYPASFEALRAHLAARTRPVRIASIGCATGQEAYGAAASALAAMGEGAGVSVEGFDRNPAAIDIARRAAWTGSLALRGTVPEWAAAWVRIDDGGAWLHPAVRASVTWTHVRSSAHLLDALDGRSFDVVLCRNLLIYLDAPTRASLVGAITRAIPVGGLLMLGHAESFEHGNEWTRDERSESFCWHRDGLAPLIPPPGDRAQQDAVRTDPARVIAPSPSRATTRGARSPVGRETDAAPGDAGTAALRAQVDAIFARAEDAMGRGDDAGARACLEQVVYLAPQHDLAMLALASVCDRLGRVEDGARWRARAQRAGLRGREPS